MIKPSLEATNLGTGVAAAFPSEPARSPNAEESELHDWNTYYQLLQSGKLTCHRGKYVAVSGGEVVAVGDDPRELRLQVSQKEGVAAERVVVVFVDDTECLIFE
jgi:Family of unknown function (DUF5678)